MKILTKRACMKEKNSFILSTVSTNTVNFVCCEWRGVHSHYLNDAKDHNQNTIAFDIVDMHHVSRSSKNHTMQFLFNGHRMRKTMAHESQNIPKVKTKF